MTERFRFENDSVYEWDQEAHAYIFCGKLNGKSHKQFIAVYDWDEDGAPRRY